MEHDTAACLMIVSISIRNIDSFHIINTYKKVMVLIDDSFHKLNFSICMECGSTTNSLKIPR